MAMKCWHNLQMWWNRHYLGSFFNQAKCLTNRGALVQVGLLSGGRHYLVRFTAYIIQEARLDKYNNSKIEIQEFILLTSINPLLIISFFNNPCEKRNNPVTTVKLLDRCACRLLCCNQLCLIISLVLWLLLFSCILDLDCKSSWAVNQLSLLYSVSCNCALTHGSRN